MREIIFRGQTRNGDWKKGDLSQANGVGVYINDGGYFFKVDSETVGQYTGLEDCNGVKIFEGDIVRVSSFSDNHKYLLESNEIDGTLPYEIIYSAGSFQCVNSKAYMPFDAGEWFTQLEVVGNIYDNPELLNGDANG